MHCYPDDAQDRFQLNEVRMLLAEHCMGFSAKQLALDIQPVSDLELVLLRLQQTKECFTIREESTVFPSVRYPDLREAIQTLKVDDTVLEGKDMIAIRTMADTANVLIRYLKEKSDTFPALYDLVVNCEVNKTLVEIIDKILEPPGLVRSNASGLLSNIRKKLAGKRQQASRVFLNEIRKYQKQGWLRDFNESSWNNRRVLAVIAEYKRQIKGIYHGSSDTGQTAFIEPIATVSLNNEIFELEQEERREVLRILRELTQNVRKEWYAIIDFEQMLAYADLAMAKARLAEDMEASLPRLNTKGVLRLMDARHPLLFLLNRSEGKETVPLHLTLHPKQRIVIISGPNAGGKSIALKTVGLLQLMLQSGLLVPVHSDSDICLFNAILVDIGDDQSIEMELSTYSSRLIKMKYFRGFAGQGTLFFMDEFGTGSDPELGGAIAEILLEDLTASGAYGIVTTHYTNIKLMGERTSDILNACMLFDEKSLRPMYRLITGQPGSSYTFEVGERIGLDKNFLDRARAKVDGNRIEFDKLLVRLQEEQSALGTARKELREERRATEEKAGMYTQLVARLKAQELKEKSHRDRTLKLTAMGQKFQALVELYDQNGDKKAVVRKLMIHLNNEKNRLEAERKAIREKEKQEQNQKTHTEKKRKQAEKRLKKADLAREKIETGAKVRLKNGHQKGIVESVKGEQATVVFGMMRTFAKIKDLRLVERKKK